MARPFAGDGTRPVRRTYPPRIRQEAVDRVFEAIAEAGGNRFGVIPRVARQLDIGEASLRSWVRQAETHGHSRRDHRTAVRPESLPSRPPRPRRRPPVSLHAVAAPPAPVPPPPPTATPLPRRRRTARDVVAAVRWPLAVYAVSRLVVMAAVIVAIHQPHGGLVALRRHIPWPRVPSSGRLLDGFGAWDAGWYVHVAAHWYVPPPLPPRPPLSKDIAFFPLFPVIVRVASAAAHASLLAGGAIAALVLGAAAAVAVWMAARRIAGDAAADRAVAVWCFFPGAFVLSLVYSEGLTVLCAAACLVALHRRRWVLAGVAAAVGGASQPSALVLIVCCGWAAVAAVRARREWRALSAPLLAPSGAAAYFAYLWARSGDPLVWFHSERVLWAHRKLGPYWTVISPFQHLVHTSGALDNAIRVAGLVFVVLGAVLLWRWRPPAIWSVWAFGTVALAMLSAPVGTRPRFLLVAFPLVVAVARKLRGPVLYGAVAVEAGLLGALTFVSITTLRVVP